MRSFKIFITLILIFVSAQCLAQSVSYWYKPLAAEGCKVKYSIAKQDTTYSIVVTVKSDRMKFLNNPIIMLKTFEGDVIKLRGFNLGDGSETLGIVSGNMVLPVTEISSTAQFPVSLEQLEFFRKGISKVRLSTTPIEHEREFKSDKIGKKLYNLYQKKKAKENDF